MIRRALAVLLGAALLGACSTANIAVNKNFDFGRVKRVAVVGFQDFPRRPGSGDAVTAAFEQSLLASGYDMIDRAQVAAVMGAKPAALDAKAVKSFGAKLGVDAFVMGKITELAEPRQTKVTVSVMKDYDEPIYEHRVIHTIDANGVPMDVSEDAVIGHRHRRGFRPETRGETLPGRLAIAVRMVSTATGAMAWSGTDVDEGVYPDSARSLADDVLKSVKATWPKK